MMLIETLPGMTTTDYWRMLSWLEEHARHAFLGRVGAGGLMPVPLETELSNMASTRMANPEADVRERVLAIAGRPVAEALLSMFPAGLRVRAATESSRIRSFDDRERDMDEDGGAVLTAREGMLNEDYAAVLGWLQANAPAAFGGEIRRDGTPGPWPLHHKLRLAEGDARDFPGEGRRSVGPLATRRVGRRRDVPPVAGRSVHGQGSCAGRLGAVAGSLSAVFLLGPYRAP